MREAGRASEEDGCQRLLSGPTGEHVRGRGAVRWAAAAASPPLPLASDAGDAGDVVGVRAWSEEVVGEEGVVGEEVGVPGGRRHGGRG